VAIVTPYSLGHGWKPGEWIVLGAGSWLVTLAKGEVYEVSNGMSMKTKVSGRFFGAGRFGQDDVILRLSVTHYR
jgi:hypothetical protein